LQEIDENFYQDLEEGIKELYAKYLAFSNKGEISKAGVLLGELENVKAIIKDIYEIRERKLVLTALNYARRGSKAEIENMTRTEAEIFNKIVSLLKEGRESVLGKIIAETKIKPERGKKSRRIFTTIRILKNLPPIVGIDGKVYGGFKEEDIASLPQPNADAFIKQGVAEEIKSQNPAQSNRH
jgi:DNA replication initiation complex subunit (GINS family)